MRRALFGTVLYSALYRLQVGEVNCLAMIEKSPCLHSFLQAWIPG